MTAQTKARIYEQGSLQSVQLPDGVRFATDELFWEHDTARGTLTLVEKPAPYIPGPTGPAPGTSLQSRAERLRELFARIDAEGGLEFEVERDTRPAEERELF